MSKKRMILEEVPEERNPLVPGSPENPIKLRSEKDKDLLIRLKSSSPVETDRYVNFFEPASIQRLTYLKLIELIPVFDSGNIEKLRLEIVALRRRLVDEGWTIPTKELISIVTSIDRLDLEIKKTKYALTAAGEELLLKGTVTVTV